jgi:hypothetical protein
VTFSTLCVMARLSLLASVGSAKPVTGKMNVFNSTNTNHSVRMYRYAISFQLRSRPSRLNPQCQGDDFCSLWCRHPPLVYGLIRRKRESVSLVTDTIFMRSRTALKPHQRGRKGMERLFVKICAAGRRLRSEHLARQGLVEDASATRQIWKADF